MQCKENWQLFEFSEAPVILASGPQAVTVRAGDDNDDKDDDKEDEKIMPEKNDKDGDNEYGVQIEISLKKWTRTNYVVVSRVNIVPYNTVWDWGQESLQTC